MPSPPTCPVTGRHIRYLLLLAGLSYLIYFLVDGFQQPISSRHVYICDTENHEVELTECLSLDDVTSCANLKDLNGDVATCIESSCGYKLFPHLDVSIMGSSDPFDPNAGTATNTFLSIVSVFYSLVPYILGLVYIVQFLGSGNLVPLTRFVVMGVISMVNEVVFKNLLKERRPEGSCLYFLTFGMPSGHAATSIGLLAYILLEIFVYHPNLLCGLTCQKKEQRNQTWTFKWGYGWQKLDDDIERSFRGNGGSNSNNGPAGDSVAIDVNENEGGASSEGGDVDSSRYVVADEADPAAQPLLEKKRESNVSSLSPVSMLSFREKWMYHLHALGYILLLVPVPLSRVYLHDHFRSQVLAGSAIGIVASMLWYTGFIRYCGMRIIKWRESEWGKWWGLKFGWEEGFF